MIFHSITVFTAFWARDFLKKKKKKKKSADLNIVNGSVLKLHQQKFRIALLRKNEILS